MIYSLRGTLAYKDSGMFVVECGGVGYKCSAAMSTIAGLPKIGEEVFVYTHLNIREDAVDLFGFCRIEELNCFKQLITVSGVGPKVALGVLSAMTPETFALCVASNDVKQITQAPGVGAKTAQRIILELKDKIKNADIAKGFTQVAAITAGNPNQSEAISALVVLGYSQTEAASAIAGASADASVEEMIKIGLKALAQSR